MALVRQRNVAAMLVELPRNLVKSPVLPLPVLALVATIKAAAN